MVRPLPLQARRRRSDVVVGEPPVPQRYGRRGTLPAVEHQEGRDEVLQEFQWSSCIGKELYHMKAISSRVNFPDQ